MMFQGHLILHMSNDSIVIVIVIDIIFGDESERSGGDGGKSVNNIHIAELKHSIGHAIIRYYFLGIFNRNILQLHFSDMPIEHA